MFLVSAAERFFVRGSAEGFHDSRASSRDFDGKHEDRRSGRGGHRDRRRSRRQRSQTAGSVARGWGRGRGREYDHDDDCFDDGDDEDRSHWTTGGGREWRESDHHRGGPTRASAPPHWGRGAECNGGHDRYRDPDDDYHRSSRQWGGDGRPMTNASGDCPVRNHHHPSPMPPPSSFDRVLYSGVAVNVNKTQNQHRRSGGDGGGPNSSAVGKGGSRHDDRRGRNRRGGGGDGAGSTRALSVMGVLAFIAMVQCSLFFFFGDRHHAAVARRDRAGADLETGQYHRLHRPPSRARYYVPGVSGRSGRLSKILDGAAAAQLQAFAADVDNRDGDAQKGDGGGHQGVPPPRLAFPVTSNRDGRVLPPLSDLVDGNDVVGDVSSLLDFAIVGFAKCGTTSMLSYLSQGSNDTSLVPKERCEVGYRTAGLVRSLYVGEARAGDVPPGRGGDDGPGGVALRGLKCPREMESTVAIEAYMTYFPRTKFIVGVRHPVFWFQSMYNFRSKTGSNGADLPPPSELIGRCYKGTQNVCTHRARFQYFLSTLGKTPMITRDELELIFLNDEEYGSRKIFPTRNKIFLYEMSQLTAEEVDVMTVGDGAPSPLAGGVRRSDILLEEERIRRLDVFREDLRSFLGLKGPLPPKVRHIKPGTTRGYRGDGGDKGVDSKGGGTTINICDDEHSLVRAVLVEHGRRASRWLREYFLRSEDVVVSSREYLEGLLRRWERDPCSVPVGDVHLT